MWTRLQKRLDKTRIEEEFRLDQQPSPTLRPAPYAGHGATVLTARRTYLTETNVAAIEKELRRFWMSTGGSCVVENPKVSKTFRV
jgi:hypothetical protein